MSISAVSKFKSIRDFPELVEYLGDELDWPIETDDFEEMTFEYSAAELGLDEKTAPKFLEIRRLRPLDKDQPWGIFFIRFDDSKLPVVALRRLLSKLVLKKRSTSNSGDRASWHESDLLLISQTGNLGTQSISFAHFAANPEKTDLPILKVLGWDDDDTGLKIDYVIETLREKLVWPDDTTDSDAWRAQWRNAFTLKNREVIQSSKEMAERLGQLALAIRTRLRELLAIEIDRGPIHNLMSVFKENLISDLDTDSFSDMYAQTIAYGLLSARIINPKANTADAAHTQIPITNPFLRDLMETFLNVGGRSHRTGVGLDFDELGINEVVDLLDNTNMEAVLRDFGDRNQKEDPVMHFFEGFLREYDNKIRKDRGVFYTPQPVVSFIVRSVDEQLRSEFGLKDGLADTTTWGELAARIKDLEIPEGTSPDQAFVQILDPATGTGTFPVEVIDLIYKKVTAKWQSQGNRDAQIKELWNEYVPEHLLPRLHGYELMMAPYAIAHMKIGLKLYETGYRFKSDQRASIYLTNALEPSLDTSGTFAFAIPALAVETAHVNKIKERRCFTVVMGNPPYSKSSANRTPSAEALVEKYKKHVKKEKNTQPLSDDYIKFLGLAHRCIVQSNFGICAMVTNRGYLVGLIHRGIRQQLLADFNSIQIFDLHGDSKVGENIPFGSKNENVFDIQQGVAVHFFSRFPNNRQKISLFDLWGTRSEKFNFLNNCKISTLEWIQCSPDDRFFFFKPALRKSAELCNVTLASLNELFLKHQGGIKTHRDALVIDFSEMELRKKIKAFLSVTAEDSMSAIRRTILKDKHRDERYHCIQYRPFDFRYIFYHPAIIDRPRQEIMKHMLMGDNTALVGVRQVPNGNFNHALVSGLITEMKTGSHDRGADLFPLYLYFSEKDLKFTSFNTADSNGCSLNLNLKYLKIFSEAIGLHLVDQDKGDLFETIGHKNFFHYIYAVLHSPAYRVGQSEDLRVDFAKIPLSGKKILLRQLCGLGEQLSSLHLMNASHENEGRLKISGDDGLAIEKVSYSDETIWVNNEKSLGFKGVSEQVWNFHIGGYQVCQKWLKDRGPKKGNPGRFLTTSEINHFKNIIFVINKTLLIMTEIDVAIKEYGGWPDAFIDNENK